MNNEDKSNEMILMQVVYRGGASTKVPCSRADFFRLNAALRNEDSTLAFFSLKEGEAIFELGEVVGVAVLEDLQ